MGLQFFYISMELGVSPYLLGAWVSFSLVWALRLFYTGLEIGVPLHWPWGFGVLHTGPGPKVSRYQFGAWDISMTVWGLEFLYTGPGLWVPPGHKVLLYRPLDLGFVYTDWSKPWGLLYSAPGLGVPLLWPWGFGVLHTGQGLEVSLYKFGVWRSSTLVQVLKFFYTAPWASCTLVQALGVCSILVQDFGFLYTGPGAWFFYISPSLAGPFLSAWGSSRPPLGLEFLYTCLDLGVPVHQPRGCSSTALA